MQNLKPMIHINYMYILMKIKIQMKSLLVQIVNISHMMLKHQLLHLDLQVEILILQIIYKFN